VEDRVGNAGAESNDRGAEENLYYPDDVESPAQ
jgi:hypothetical protein